MVSGLQLYASLMKIAVLVTGLTILYFTVRAAHRRADDGLWVLSLGILLTGLGLVLSGLFTTVLSATVEFDIAVSSTVSAAGLAVIVYSMFTEGPAPVGP